MVGPCYFTPILGLAAFGLQGMHLFGGCVRRETIPFLAPWETDNRYLRCSVLSALPHPGFVCAACCVIDICLCVVLLRECVLTLHSRYVYRYLP